MTQQTRTRTYGILAGVLTAVAILALVVFTRKNPSDSSADGLPWRFSSGTGGDRAAFVAADGGGVSSEDSADGNAEGASAFERYENVSYGFSFAYPAGMKISELADDAGDVILAEQGTGGFQIFITPWDEGGDVITPERIRRDVPDSAVEHPQEAVIDGGIRALIFEGHADAIGKTREVWLVHGGYLYQITAPLSFDGELARIMGTWVFQ